MTEVSFNEALQPVTIVEKKIYVAKITFFISQHQGA